MKMDRTRTLLFGVFVLARQPLSAAQVIRLAKPLGISASNVKSHLTRLVSEGALTRSGPVRLATYAPSRSQAVIVEGIEARLEAARLNEVAEPWDGAWLMLAVRLPRNRSERERIRALLWFDGFRPLSGDVFARPAWPKQWALRRAGGYPGSCMYGALLSPLDRPQLEALYSLADLDREAKRLAKWIRARSIPASDSRAFALRLDVGGRVARLIGHDPRLPPVLWGPRTGLIDLIAAYRELERRIAPAAERFVSES